MKPSLVATLIAYLTLQLAAIFLLSVPTVSAANANECMSQYNGRSLGSSDEQAKVQAEMQANGCAEFCSITSERVGGVTTRTVSCSPCDPSSADAEECEKLHERFTPGNPGSVECDEPGNCAKETMFAWCGNKTEGVGVQCLINDVLAFLSVGVGIAVVAGVIIGGITYSTSQGNPAQVQKGITIIANSAIGLVMYLLLWAIIQWLIPGGVFQ